MVPLLALNEVELGAREGLIVASFLPTDKARKDGVRDVASVDGIFH